jgi:hypothetical protein
LIPEGSGFLSQTRVNDAIYQLLSAPLKRENGDSLKLESALTKSAIVQAEVIQKIFDLKKFCLPVRLAWLTV